MSDERFIGRAEALARVGRLLDDFRLVVLLGPGGIGKTRLARRLIEARTGAQWVELADVEHADDLHDRVAAALGATRDTRLPLSEALVARGELLLVLDNFEQLVDGGAARLHGWLRAAPRLRVLVTSRRRLEVGGEVSFELSPLSLPGDGPAPSEARAMLIDRLRRHRPDLEPDAQAVSATLDQIVTRLDGIPLAIELAAAQMRFMQPVELLARLDTHADLLRGGPRTAAQRHRTVRRTIEGSWAALPAVGRRALAACSVFRGGFTLDAAEAVLTGDVLCGAAGGERGRGEVVLGGDGMERLRPAVGVSHADGMGVTDWPALARRTKASGGREPEPGMGVGLDLTEGAEPLDDRDVPDAMRALAILRDHSLVWARADAPDAMRYGLYAPIRAFAAEKLDRHRPTADAVRAQHAAWCAARPRLGEGGTAPSTVRALAREQDNLAAALEGASEPALAVELALRLAELRVLEGAGRAAGQAIERALALVEPEPRVSAPVAELYLLRGRLRLFATHRAGAEDDRAQAAVLCPPDDSILDGQIIAFGATLARSARQAARAEGLYRAAIERLRGTRHVGVVLSGLAGLLMEQGRLDAAREVFSEALDALRAAGDVQHEAVTVGNLGLLEQERGDFAGARQHFEQALALHVRLGYRRFAGITRFDLGGLCFEEGRPADALAHYEAGIEMLAAVGDARHEALARSAYRAASAAADRPVMAARAEIGERRMTLDDPVFTRAIAFYELVASVATSPADDRLRARARGFLDGFGDDVGDDTHADEIRLARRLLVRALEAAERGEASLRIGPGGAWFAPPNGDPVDIGGREALCGIVEALAVARFDGGAPLGLEALVRAGWPGQRVLSSAARNRVHVALSTLRGLGLDGLIERVDGGYRFVLAVPVVRRARLE